MAKTQSSVKEFAMIGFVLLAVLFGMQIMAFIFGSLATIDIADVTTAVTNESIVPVAGVGTISGATNINFVTWNATSIYNQTVGAAGHPSNNTFVEGTDYQIFAGNGTFGVISAEWNASFVSYSVTRKTEVEVVSEETTNQSLHAIGDYANQSGTQFTTLGIAITLVILVAVFLFFWVAFMGKGKGKEAGPGGFS